jgi:hypothetical protein
MQKIIIPALLLLLLFRKKKPVVVVPIDDGNGGGVEPATETLTGLKKTLMQTINETFADNASVPDEKTMLEIIAEIKKAGLNSCELLLSFFMQLNNGDNISEYTYNSIDEIAPQFNKLFIAVAALGVANIGNKYKEYSERDGNSDVWEMLDKISENLPYGRAVYGVAQLIGNLFCGKRCRMRRLERAGVGVEAKNVYW